MTRLVIIITLAATYFCTAQLGQKLAFLPDNLSAVWIPTGITLAAILLLGYEVWPGIALGSFLWLMWELQSITLPTSATVSLAVASSITVGETLKPVLIAILLNRFVERGAIFKRVENVGKFVLIASIGSMISAVIALTTLCLSSLIPWSDYGFTWWSWWLSSIISILIFTPLLLTYKPKQVQLNNHQTIQQQELLILPFHASNNLLVEGILLFMLVLMVSLCTFGGGYP
ncbi:MAG: hypothetical protein F6K21_19730, partial [Symploca sp. SIO2D2]|nr:hypothetical protein [Symploca sp. SIO2D2]